MHLTTLHVRIVHTGQTGTALEAQGRVVTQHLDELQQLLRTDEEGNLAAIDEGQAVREVRNQLLHPISDLVEPATIGTLGTAGHLDGADDTAITGGITRPGGCPPHALTGVDATILLGPLSALGRGMGLVRIAGIEEVAAVGNTVPGVRAASGTARSRLITHRMSPFCSRVVGASRARFSLVASTSDM